MDEFQKHANLLQARIDALRALRSTQDQTMRTSAIHLLMMNKPQDENLTETANFLEWCITEAMNDLHTYNVALEDEE